MRYSGLRVFAEGLFGNRGWKPVWREPEPKSEYDVVIIGGGGHGLSTAYYLAKNHGITNVAVLEKGYIGGGNVGRNTTIVRANYFLPGNSEFYSHSLKLWEKLEGELAQDGLAAAGLAVFKRPERLEVVAQLPRNPVGKVIRSDLAKLVDAAVAGAG